MYSIKQSESVRSVSALDKIKKWWAAIRPSKRRLAQLYCAILYNANIKGFLNGTIYSGPSKAVCVPGLNCYSCPGAVGACPLGALQNAVASSGARAGTYVIGILMLFGIILGRTVCGWLCPFGMLQELLYKIPVPKIPKSRVTRVLSYLKHVILILFVIMIPLWAGLKKMPLPAFCKYICPAGTLEGAGPLLMSSNNSGLFPLLGSLFTNKFVILAIIGLACIFCFRSFCRFLCPLGALYGFFCRLAIIGLKVYEQKCTHCGACVNHCKMDVRHVGDHECIHCGECRGVCPAHAISWNGKHIPQCGKSAASKPQPVFESENQTGKKASRVFRGVLIGVLLLALIYYNFLAPLIR